MGEEFWRSPEKKFETHLESPIFTVFTAYKKPVKTGK
jgi:hypothetical protein